MYLFFDTETTGLPKNWRAKMIDVENWPRVIQLGYQIYGSDRRLMDEKNMLIQPDGWEIPTAEFWRVNGFYQEKSKKHGVDIAQALNDFTAAYERSKYMIAHNMSFDYNVLGAEMIRAGVKPKGNKIQIICTKEESVDFCKLPGNYGTYKWPKLEELYQILFKQDFDGAHDALADVKATARCFFELQDRGVIILP